MSENVPPGKEDAFDEEFPLYAGPPGHRTTTPIAPGYDHIPRRSGVAAIMFAAGGPHAMRWLRHAKGKATGDFAGIRKDVKKTACSPTRSPRNAADLGQGSSPALRTAWHDAWRKAQVRVSAGTDNSRYRSIRNCTGGIPWRDTAPAEPATGHGGTSGSIVGEVPAKFWASMRIITAGMIRESIRTQQMGRQVTGITPKRAKTRSTYRGRNERLPRRRKDRGLWSFPSIDHRQGRGTAGGC